MEDDQVAVGAVGRLVWEKGYGELFAAARWLRTRRPDVVMVVAGPYDADKGDPLTPADVAMAEAAGVRFLGHRDDPERLYAAFDLYVLASHREGFPRSAMEAAASGLPIVATDIRGCREVVEHTRTGLLVPVREAAVLAAAIERMAGDAALRRRMGEAAVAKARGEFDQRRVIIRTLDAYGELNRRPPEEVRAVRSRFGLRKRRGDGAFPGSGIRSRSARRVGLQRPSTDPISSRSVKQCNR
jgi:glycosyltransferase involved in cell wall biosynthesis